jgi:uncharacterized repeat protein (TIGR03806 family)
MQADAGPPPDSGVTPAQYGLDMRPSNATCLAPDRPAQGAAVELNRVFENVAGLNQPVALIQAPGDDTTFYLVQRGGQIKTFDNDPAANSTEIFADLSGFEFTSGPGEAGLLGMAFAPDFSSSGQVYLSYTAPGVDPDGCGNQRIESRISRFTLGNGDTQLQRSSEEILLRLDQPFGNHNGGHIAFGPDGHLYISFGDGGSGGDPCNSGQDTSTLLGSILRIDVGGGGAAYAIPPDNPFVAGGGAPEIYAYGLRNVWRFSFDREAQTLWAGDVGQNQWEEVSIIENGGNYGWRCREGAHDYNTDNCPTGGLVEPVAEYDHTEGRSITGGFVYRGATIPTLQGVYLYADYVFGTVWGLFENNMTGAWEPQVLSDSGLKISSFAEDNAGELYVLSYDNGRIYRFDPAAGGSTNTFPQLLSETGCMDNADPRLPGPALIPYDVNAPLFSDDADKERFMALPDGEVINIEADGDMDLPVGTVLIKHFKRGGVYLETRFLIRHDDGEWGGYTYEWNDAQNDATLLSGGKIKDVADGQWAFPSTGQCMACHTAISKRAIGLEVGQLNGEAFYPSTGRLSNQMETWSHIGLFSNAPDGGAETLEVYPDPTGSAALEDRARAYLHANCAHCHRTGGPGQSNMDLLFSTPLGDANLCNVDPGETDLGIANVKLLTPGDPATSMIVERMKRRDVYGMPPLGTLFVHTDGVILMEDWITGLAACP